MSFHGLIAHLKRKKSVNNISLYCCLSVAKFYPTLCDPVNCRTPASLPCHSPSPRICSNSYPLSWWWYPTISSSIFPFFSCPQSFSASGSFPMSHLLCCWKRVFAMTSSFSWQNSVSLCPALFCTSRPNLPVTPGISWLHNFAFQSPIMKRTSFLGVSSRCSCRSS